MYGCVFTCIYWHICI